jgi:hypothetical protein
MNVRRCYFGEVRTDDEMVETEIYQKGQQVWCYGNDPYPRDPSEITIHISRRWTTGRMTHRNGEALYETCTDAKDMRTWPRCPKFLRTNLFETEAEIQKDARLGYPSLRLEP